MKFVYEVQQEEIGEGQPERHRRGYWANKLEFIFACFGTAWGSFGTWARFPYLCYINGGFPVFFAAYVVMLAHVGFPLLLLEMTLGQYGSRGVLTVWWMCPLFMGVGVCVLLYLSVTLTYMVPFLSWPVYYMYTSVTSSWKSCVNLWNTDRRNDGNVSTRFLYEFLNPSTCEERFYRVDYNDGLCYNSTDVAVAIHNEDILNRQSVPPIDECFPQYLPQSSSITSFEIGDIERSKIACLVICWIIIAACLCLGVRSLSKVVYFTGIVPLVLLIAFLIRALTLPGAKTAMPHLFTPDYQKLLDPKIWASAFAEVMYTMGLGYGGYITLSSYNRFRNFYVLDGILVLVVHVIVKLMAAVIVFGFVGHLAEVKGLAMNEVMRSGPNLIFVVIPAALSDLTGSSAWSFFFFFLVFVMMLGVTLTMVEVISTALSDLWSPLKRFRFITPIVLSFVFFLIGILFCTKGGHQLLTSLDMTLGPYVLFVLIIAMCTCVAMFYGAWNLRYDIVLMLGNRHIFIKAIAALALIPCVLHWFILPITSSIRLIYGAINHSPYSQFYNNLIWAENLSYALLALILLPIVLFPIIVMLIAGCRDCGITPFVLPDSRWGPNLTRFQKMATHLPHVDGFVNNMELRTLQDGNTETTGHSDEFQQML